MDEVIVVTDRVRAFAAPAAVEPWDRTRMLPRLIPVGPEELADESREGRLAMLRRLARALRGERMRGRAGHWSYSLDRHVALVRAWAAEHRLIAATEGRRDRARERP
ncbi:MAG: DUF6477 family protein [Siculibacillus sp.]|nr:DUF6477 family protein [Siculibacillus sp.]